MANKIPASLRVGVWVRVSTPDQAQGESPEHHLIRGKQYAAMNDWTVVETYDLAGVSGKTVWEHPECQRMLRDVKRGHIHGLIFSKLARLARNTRELLDFAEYFQEQNAHLISLEEKFDTSTPAGRLFFTFIGAIASWEREEIASRVKASIAVRAKLGKPLGGKSPYGFKWLSQKLVAVPDEIQVRRLAFDLFLQHRRKGAVARILNDKGYRTREGKKFRDMNVRRMLECYSAIGHYRTNQWRALKGGRRELKDEDEWGSIECEPVVSEDTFRRVNEALEQQIKPARKPGKKPVHIFAGLLRCSCGGKLYVYTRSPNYTCSKCKNKISMCAMDEIFLGAIAGELTDTSRLAGHIQRARQKVRERQTQLSGIRKQIDQTKAEMHKIYELYIAGGVTVDRFKQINGPLEERLAQLVAEQPRIEGEISAIEVNNLSADVIAQEAKGLATLWPTLNSEEKQRLASLMCSEILIPTDPNEEIKITLTTGRNGGPSPDDPPNEGPGSGGNIPPPRTKPPSPSSPSNDSDPTSRVAPPSQRQAPDQGIFDSSNRLNIPHNLGVGVRHGRLPREMSMRTANHNVVLWSFSIWSLEHAAPPVARRSETGSKPADRRHLCSDG